MSNTTFDPQPLLALVDKATADGPDSEVASLLGVAARTITRWRRGSQISEPVADRAAISLGLHPALIWSDWFAKATDD